MDAKMLLLIATLVYAGRMVHALMQVRAGRWMTGGGGWWWMLLGFVLQTGVLYWRGQEVGQCPMKSISDLLVFVGWSMVLLYFLVGSAFRMSLLGLFTAPLVALLNGVALVLPRGFGVYPDKSRVVVLVELHAALALVAYAAFALAAVTGVMYLLQQRLLKKHRIGDLFYQLPPISELGRVIFRLVLSGWLLLTLALGLTFGLEMGAPGAKLIFTWGVWVLYAGIGVMMWRHVVSARRTAWLAVLGFAVPFVSLWII